MPKPTVRCLKCGMTFRSMKAFRSHIKGHIKKKETNPSLPKGKFIPCKAVKINSNGSVSVRL